MSSKGVPISIAVLHFQVKSDESSTDSEMNLHNSMKIWILNNPRIMGTHLTWHEVVMPPTIIKQIPAAINNRLLALWSNKYYPESPITKKFPIDNALMKTLYINILLFVNIVSDPNHKLKALLPPDHDN